MARTRAGRPARDSGKTCAFYLVRVRCSRGTQDTLRSLRYKDAAYRPVDAGSVAGPPVPGEIPRRIASSAPDTLRGFPPDPPARSPQSRDPRISPRSYPAASVHRGPRSAGAGCRTSDERTGPNASISASVSSRKSERITMRPRFLKSAWHSRKRTRRSPWSREGRTFSSSRHDPMQVPARASGRQKLRSLSARKATSEALSLCAIMR